MAAGRTDAGRTGVTKTDAGYAGSGGTGNESYFIHTDTQRCEGSIEKSLAGSLGHAEPGNTGMQGAVCPTELVLSASYHYSYDAQGNTLSDGENQYRYDSLNRLTEIETQNGDLQRNRYDGEGLRAELEENGELTRFLYSGRDVVAEQDEKNNTVRYVRGLELLSSDSECARTYYHYASDEIGSITHVTDESGTVLNRYVYDAFGNQRIKEETVQNRFRFTGEICDGLTGQYYLRARFYNPVIGRFLNEDTYYGDGLNLYSYCRNNPVRYVDPSGHWCEDKQARIDKYKEQGFSEADAEKMANYEKLRETEGVDAAEKYLREQKALVERNGSKTRLIPGNEGVVTGGNSTELGKNMMEAMGQKRGTKWTGHQAQHIIPAELSDYPILQKIGMDLDDASNGIFLRTPSNDVSTMSRHRGYHSVYNEFVKSQLDAIDLNQSTAAIQKQVYNLQNSLRKLQQSGLPLYPGQGASLDLWQRSLNRVNGNR